MPMTVPEIKRLADTASPDELAALERSLAADTRKGVKDALAKARRRLERVQLEHERVDKLFETERSLAHASDDAVIVGLDEVGRGAVAGPLAVGAVVFDGKPFIEGLDDSKKVRPDRRRVIAAEIKRSSRAWAVGYVEPSLIDSLGMAQALRLAFSRALGDVEAQGVHADVVLIDGLALGVDEREVNVVKGDATCASIAAASIVAKVERDALMSSLGSEYEAYAFVENKGYASPHHIEAIRAHGLSDVHRATFCTSFMQQTLF